jgi:hypothetical protein
MVGAQPVGTPAAHGHEMAHGRVEPSVTLTGRLWPGTRIGGGNEGRDVSAATLTDFPAPRFMEEALQ